MLISLKEYAEKNGVSPITIRTQCLSGKFKTARKIGRNWVIDSEENRSEIIRNYEKKGNKNNEKL